MSTKSSVVDNSQAFQSNYYMKLNEPIQIISNYNHINNKNDNFRNDLPSMSLQKSVLVVHNFSILIGRFWLVKYWFILFCIPTYLLRGVCVPANITTTIWLDNHRIFSCLSTTSTSSTFDLFSLELTIWTWWLMLPFVQGCNLLTQRI